MPTKTWAGHPAETEDEVVNPLWHSRQYFGRAPVPRIDRRPRLRRLLDRGRLEEEHAQGREREREVEGSTPVRLVPGPDAPLVAHVRAVVDGGVGVEDLAVEAPAGDADLVVLADDRGEVADDHHRVIRVLRPAEEGEHAVLPVMQLE